jgi:hypothetical protein
MRGWFRVILVVSDGEDLNFAVGFHAQFWMFINGLSLQFPTGFSIV